jgi:hypothetical protein
MIKEALYSGTAPKSHNKKAPQEIVIPGLPETFSSSQKDAVVNALSGRLSLI